LQVPPEVDVAKHHVGVAVEHPGQKVLARDVHLLITIEIEADLHDPAILDEHLGWGGWSSCAIEKHSA
jgi:hypothetical protein